MIPGGLAYLGSTFLEPSSRRTPEVASGYELPSTLRIAGCIKAGHRILCQVSWPPFIVQDPNSLSIQQEA